MTYAAASTEAAPAPRRGVSRLAFNWRLVAALALNFGVWWLIGAAVLRIAQK